MVLLGRCFYFLNFSLLSHLDTEPQRSSKTMPGPNPFKLSVLSLLIPFSLAHSITLLAITGLRACRHRRQPPSLLFPLHSLVSSPISLTSPISPSSQSLVGPMSRSLLVTVGDHLHHHLRHRQAPSKPSPSFSMSLVLSPSVFPHFPFPFSLLPAT